MLHRTLLMVLALFFIAACGGTASETMETSAPDQPTEPATPQAFVDALDAAMVREGKVLHTMITATGSDVGAEPEDLWTDEIWIFAAENSARHLFHRAPENSEELAAEEIFVTVDGVTFSDSGGYEIDISSASPNRTCPLVETPSMVYIATNLFCARYTPQEGDVNELIADVQSNVTFEGQPAIALVYTARNEVDPAGTPEPERLPPLIISTLFADRETMLPLGWSVEIYATPEQKVTISGRYSNQFIDRDNLAVDFFSPITLIEPEPTVSLYWLGSELDPDGDLPMIVPNELTLSQAPDNQPDYQVRLTYSAPPGAEPWITEIDIQQWARTDWEAALDSGLLASELWLYPCAKSRTIDLERGNATIFQTYEPEPNGPLPGEEGDCPEVAFDRFIGVVHADETVLLIHGPGNQLHPRSLGEGDDPYDSDEGVEAVIRGLTILGIAHSNDQGSATDTPSLEDVYAGLAETLERDGRVLHLTRTVTGEVTGFMELETTIHYWVDIGEPVARIEHEGSFEYVEEDVTLEGRSHIVIRDGTEYSTSDGDIGQDEPRAVEAAGCYGQPEAIAVIIGCPGPTETSTTTVEWGKHDGQPALLLITEGESHGSDEVSRFIRRTYLIPKNYLPIYSEQEGIFDIGSEYPETMTTIYEHQFIERSSISDEFFELSDIGYTEPDQAALIDEYFDTPVYWLGERFEPDGELQPLTLSVVTDSTDEHYSIPGHIAVYDGVITYSLADNPHGPPVAMLEIWSVSDWNKESGRGVILDGLASRPCSSHESMRAPEGAEATLYQWLEPESVQEIPTPSSQPSCEDSGTVRYTAIVEFPESVVVIDAPASSSPRDGARPSPYSSAIGMQTIIAGLDRR